MRLAHLTVVLAFLFSFSSFAQQTASENWPSLSKEEVWKVFINKHRGHVLPIQSVLTDHNNDQYFIDKAAEEELKSESADLSLVFIHSTLWRNEALNRIKKMTEDEILKKLNDILAIFTANKKEHDQFFKNRDEFFKVLADETASILSKTNNLCNINLAGHYYLPDNLRGVLVDIYGRRILKEAPDEPECLADLVSVGSASWKEKAWAQLLKIATSEKYDERLTSALDRIANDLSTEYRRRAETVLQILRVDLGPYDFLKKEGTSAQ